MNRPIVDDDAFNGFVESHINLPYEKNLPEVVQRTHKQIIALARTSALMAYMLAGDVNIPRPRRLGEHNQSVTNVYEHVFGGQVEASDHMLRVYLTVFQDCGKSYGVAVDGTSVHQATHNSAVMNNILSRTEALDEDAKKIFMLLQCHDILGKAIRRYKEKQHPLEEVVAEAVPHMNILRSDFPEAYKDRSEKYMDIVFRADTGAHTQHRAARFVETRTNKVKVDVTNHDRRVAGRERGPDATLDKLYSEAPSVKNKLKFYHPKDLAILERLLPTIYGRDSRD